jgi:hypothetical protein
MANKWTEKDDKFLTTQWSIIDKRPETAEVLGRTVSACAARMRKLNQRSIDMKNELTYSTPTEELVEIISEQLEEIKELKVELKEEQIESVVDVLESETPTSGDATSLVNIVILGILGLTIYYFSQGWLS